MPAPTRCGKQIRQNRVHFAFLNPIRASTPPDHAGNGTNLWDSGQQTDSDIAAALIKTLQDLRRPNIHRT